jgi:acetyltransferase-like isoleucine patch superfamily enzyme
MLPQALSDQPVNMPVIFEAQIKDDVLFGENVKVVSPVNLYGCKIGAHSFIGPFVEIQKDVVIGEKCKIQSHTFICELVTIGNNCFIGHGVMFINDLFSGGGPAGGDKTKWKSTLIGNNISIGSNATILPVEICDGAVIGAGAVVTKDISRPGYYVGNPAKLLKLI